MSGCWEGDARGNTQRLVTGKQVAFDPVLQAVIETSDDAIFTCDDRGKITSWSATAQRLSGFRADEVLDGGLDGLFPEHLHDEVRSLIIRALAGERIKHFESEMVRTDGMPMPVWLSLCPIVDPDRIPLGAVVIARDVTEQHLAQATLAEVEARLQEGEALAHVGSWLWDVRTGAVQWSIEFYRIHGVDPLDFDGTFESHLGLIHPDDRVAQRAAMEESVDCGVPYEHQYRIVRPDHQVRLVQVRAHPSIGSAGKAVGLRGIGQDVTERTPLLSHDPPGA